MKTTRTQEMYLKTGSSLEKKAANPEGFAYFFHFLSAVAAWNKHAGSSSKDFLSITNTCDIKEYHQAFFVVRKKVPDANRYFETATRWYHANIVGTVTIQHRKSMLSTTEPIAHNRCGKIAQQSSMRNTPTPFEHVNNVVITGNVCEGDNHLPGDQNLGSMSHALPEVLSKQLARSFHLNLKQTLLLQLS